MDRIKALIRKYPNRIKYGILVLNIFAMIVAVKTYVNYVSIETAIEGAVIQKHIKTDELAFTQNFLIDYEKSEYAKYFLEHENNMLMRDEYIIKFEEMYKKQEQNTGSTSAISSLNYENMTITTPPQSRKKFLQERMNH